MKHKTLFNPHDKFFKESFSRKDIAQSFLQEYLPSDLCNQFNFKSLEIIKDTYIDKELTEHFSDIVYRIKILGKSTFIYLLFEHKSYRDNLIGFQLLRNMVKIWEQYLKQHKKSKMLPIIVPMVIYQGRKTWSGTHLMRRLFYKIKGTSEYIPDFQVLLN
jgi:predicted transposase/invertase (TIGR01784 family)